MGSISMTASRQLDTRLVEETLAGSQAAFEELVVRYQSRLFALARRYSRNAMDVEDIVQDAFLKAYSKLHTFDHRASFYTWIYRIATNTILDGMKRRGRSPVQHVEDPEVLGEVTPVNLPSPSAKMEENEISCITQEVLGQMPDIFRAVLVMREFDGLAYQEIADTLGISIGTVESRLFRARARFKDKLLALYPEFGEA
ncbi:MAG: RNA polymerase sigma-70 factor (ECF subfamily) [Candidatus Paceibacteria bacterium]|jgi:RNA polymerase sigma-70 factor (ECF subfamily)